MTLYWVIECVNMLLLWGGVACWLLSIIFLFTHKRLQIGIPLYLGGLGLIVLSIVFSASL